MAALSVGNAWNDTARFVRREGGLIFPIALALIALPNVVVQWLTPTAAPGQSPEPGLWTWAYLPAMVLTLLGSLAIVLLALGREDRVGSAISAAARRLVPVLVAALLVSLLMLGMLVLGVMIAFAAGMTTMESLQTGGASPGLGLVVAFTLIVVILVSVRFLFINQVVADSSLGPVAALKRSWALSWGHFWKLFALLLLVGVILLVLTLAVTAIGGIIVALLTGSAQPGTTGGFLILLLLGLLNAVVTVYLLVLLTRLYEQLARGGETSGT